MGDERSYENVIAIRSVDTTDFMTADFSHIPYEVLSTISSRIINEVRGVNRVVYDISSKPPPPSSGNDPIADFGLQIADSCRVCTAQLLWYTG